MPFESLVASPRSPLSYSYRAKERAWCTTMARLEGSKGGSDGSDSVARRDQFDSRYHRGSHLVVSEGEESDWRSECSARLDDADASASIWAHALTTFSVRSAPAAAAAAADQQSSRPLEKLFEGPDGIANIEGPGDSESPLRSVSEAHYDTSKMKDELPTDKCEASTPSGTGLGQRGELRHTMVEHWKWTVRECCKACMGDYFTEDNYGVIMDLAWQAVESIQDKLLPLADGGGNGDNNMDILKLVKVRTLTGCDYECGPPSLEPSYYLRGAMFHHNVANTEMPLWRANAGIVCIQGSIEFEAPNKSGYIPMDFLRAQEQSYIDIVVRKIVSLGGPATPVQILLCGGRVTRWAYSYAVVLSTSDHTGELWTLSWKLA